MLPPMKPLTFLSLMALCLVVTVFVASFILHSDPAEALIVVPNEAPPGFVLWVDPVSGCHYFVSDPHVNTSRVIMARLNEYKNPMCGDLYLRKGTN